MFFVAFEQRRTNFTPLTESNTACQSVRRGMVHLSVIKSCCQESSRVIPVCISDLTLRSFDEIESYPVVDAPEADEFWETARTSSKSISVSAAFADVPWFNIGWRQACEKCQGSSTSCWRTDS